ncbi:amino acid ABC transporter ATP-binding/permease protein [Atopobium sp. oral taxon 416]|uniref:amino acid ABC transporter ATP-binding/permease protein n=1 Tax=Atopobium sp. oral taxon 416 TaxID=712157 RepID=UPI0020124171|nr:ABC transporter ATP-binding protein [Atopobium sp. oral taxon 416]
MKKLRIMGRMLGFVRPLAGVMVISVVAGIAGFVCATALPVVGVEAMLAVNGTATLIWGIATFCRVLVILAIARGVLHYIEQECNHYIAFKLLAHIRDLVFGKLRTLAPAKLSGRDRGDLISTITSDIELLEVFFAHTISPVLIAIGTGIILMSFLANLSWAFALIALAGYLAVGIVVPLVVSHASGSVGVDIREQQASLSSTMLDNLRGLDQIIQYGMGVKRGAELDQKSRSLAAEQKRLHRVARGGSIAVNVIMVLDALAQLFVGIYAVSQSMVTPEAFVLAEVTTLSSFGPFIALANLGSTLQQTLAAGERVLAILDEEPLVQERAKGTEPVFTGASAEQVGFSYGEEQVLNNVNFMVPKGGIVALVGKSGSGKSTLCRLFMRFWDVDSGAICIGPDNIKDITSGYLHQQEALVEQQTMLFHDSIRNNLLIAKPDATQEELEEACHKASVLDFIESLPEGFDTIVGELGGTLSGGERQRLGLARAFLHEAPFVLLDEPTSNLDALNEGAILKALDMQRSKCSIMLITHRPSSAAIADKVVSIDRGRVS